MKESLCRALAVLILLSGAAFAYDADGNLGLRSAERRGPTRILLQIGPAVNEGDIPKKPHTFQVVSPTDPRFRLGVSAAAARVLGPADADPARLPQAPLPGLARLDQPPLVAGPAASADRAKGAG